MKLKLTKALVTSVATSVGLLGASAGLVFGVSAGMYHVGYMDLDTIETRLSSAMAQNCYSQNVKSQWNMLEGLDPHEQDISQAKWEDLHGSDVPMPKCRKNSKEDPGWITPGQAVTEDEANKRWHFATMAIDGSTHSTLDRSFNQSLYNGIINFIQGKDVNGTLLKSESTVEPTSYLNNYTAASFKPSEDNNNGLTSTYKAIASSATPYRILGLAGFNHVSPLGDLGATNEHGVFEFGTQFQDLKKMLMLLIDGSVSGNQAISSVLFRADQPGFLTALATCMYFYNNLHIYHKDYKDLSVALYGGNPIPTVTVYMGGYQRGVEFFNRFVLFGGMLRNEFYNTICIDENPLGEGEETGKLINNPDVKKLIDYSKYKDEIYNYLGLTLDQRKSDEGINTRKQIVKNLYEEYQVREIKLGSFATHFTGSFSSGDAIGITKQYLARGASAIIAVAGPQSLDSAQEIQNQGSDCIVIGVDSAMENGQYQRKHSRSGLEDVTVAETTPIEAGAEKIKSEPVQKDNIIKFSAVKDITTVTKKFCELCIENKNFDVASTDSKGRIIPNPEKAICGVGYLTCGNILNGLISISFDGWHPLVQAMRHVTSVDGTRCIDTLWESSADQYLTSVDLPDTVKAALKDINKIDTYNPDLVIGKGDDGKEYTVEQCYTHITGILGQLLSTATCDFSGMSVVPTFDSTGKVIKVEEATQTDLTILDWLTNNMYFSC